MSVPRKQTSSKVPTPYLHVYSIFQILQKYRMIYRFTNTGTSELRAEWRLEKLWSPHHCHSSGRSHPSASIFQKLVGTLPRRNYSSRENQQSNLPRRPTPGFDFEEVLC